MTPATTKQDISRWVDEGGAGPDMDGVPPSSEQSGVTPLLWILAAGAALGCTALCMLLRPRPM